MKRLIASLVLLLILTNASDARLRWFPRFRRAPSVQKTPVQKALVTPQQKAEYKAAEMARRGVLRHLGGGFGYGASAEGIGRGPTPATAAANCCFVGQRACVATAVARGSDGTWYACRMFR